MSLDSEGWYGDRPSLSHPNPLLRIVESQTDLDQVKKEIASQKRQNLQYDRIPKGFLQTQKLFWLPVIVQDQKPFNREIICWGNSSWDVILAHHRSYYQYHQKQFWMYCSDGYAPFFEDENGDTYLICALRKADSSGSYSYRLDLFNGAPTWERSEDSILPKEILGKKSTAKKRLVERLVIYNKVKKVGVLPNLILDDDFTDTDVKKCFSSASNMVSQITNNTLQIKCIDEFLDSRSIHLNGSCDMILKFKHGSGENEWINAKKDVLAVFGTDYGGVGQNLDSMRAYKTRLNGKIQDFSLFYGDRDEVTGEPLDYPIVAIRCDKNNKPILPFVYSAIWISGQKYDNINDIVDPEIFKGLYEAKMTPVLCAVLDSFGCKIGIPKRSQKDK